MADLEPAGGETPRPEKQPFSPGMLMALGLFLLVIAAWCGYDLYSKEDWVKDEKTGTILINWGGLIGFALGAAYAFILAAIRSKSPKATRLGGKAPPPGPDGPA
ncbi:MAG: hypothetical protein IMZ55_19825 [Acidobacteria bacterium]|nr:hypothetical protein [Planctomycetota bacterium]MBE3135725.1 hypothetical protein [Acidobacteriota bacterium]